MFDVHILNETKIEISLKIWNLVWIISLVDVDELGIVRLVSNALEEVSV